MSFLYPRTVTITRAGAAVSVGLQGYQGITRASETAILTNVACAIQYKGTASQPLAGLPADIRAKSVWEIKIPGQAVGVVQDRDVATDDANQRYQVTAIYWTPLGLQLYCEKLEV